LVLFGLPGSHLVSEGEKAGLRTASEAFADRNYMPDGSLVSRRRPDAHVRRRRGRAPGDPMVKRARARRGRFRRLAARRHDLHPRRRPARGGIRRAAASAFEYEESTFARRGAICPTEERNSLPFVSALWIADDRVQ
jgi:hypothetical protein